MAEEQLSVQQVSSNTSKSTCSAASGVPLDLNKCSSLYQDGEAPELEQAQHQEQPAASPLPLPFALDENGKKQPLPGSRSIFLRGTKIVTSLRLATPH
jgi:hypothetical protein